MKAVVLDEAGELQLVQKDDPLAGPGEVLVEVRAASVNRRDLLVCDPPAPNYVFPRPLVLGSDAAGVRQDTGEDVVVYPVLGWGDGDAPAAGWQLLGGPADGTYAQLLKVPAANAFPKPPDWSWEEASTLPIAGLTAYRALVTVGRLQRGERLLVLGAGGGVSSFAIQLAHQIGATVIVTSSSSEKIERAMEIGADDGVLYTDEGWASDAGPVDMVLDSIGTTWADALDSLRTGGRLVALGATGGPQVELDVRRLYLSLRSILGTTLGSPKDFEGLLQMVARGDWRPVLDSVRPLADAAAAHDRVRAGSQTGKLVLVP